MSYFICLILILLILLTLESKYTNILLHFEFIEQSYIIFNTMNHIYSVLYISFSHH